MGSIYRGDGIPHLGGGDEMKEVKRKFDADVFSPERLERIDALRSVIAKYRVLFKGDDGDLITDALKVHPALIRILNEGNKHAKGT